MPNDNADPGIRQLNQWALDQLERTRTAFELSPNPDPVEQAKLLESIDSQIAEKRAALAG